MATVQQWSGLEAHALRLALRMSVRAFAEHLGAAVHTVSKWDKLGVATASRPDTQAILDTALARAEPAVHLRFETVLSESGRPPGAGAGRRVTSSSPRIWDYESWADDLDRTAVALSRQNFRFASSLLTRWTTRWKPTELDDKGLYLFARSAALLGDLQRDQGAVLGPLSAQHSYVGARSLFDRLEIPRRVAQLDLSLAGVAEMSGKLETAARHYEALAVDDRLSRRDRARARLWVGTALSKSGDHDYAARVMQSATREFVNYPALGLDPGILFRPPAARPHQFPALTGSGRFRIREETGRPLSQPGLLHGLCKRNRMSIPCEEQRTSCVRS